MFGVLLFSSNEKVFRRTICHWERAHIIKKQKKIGKWQRKKRKWKMENEESWAKKKKAEKKRIKKQLTH